MTIPTNTQLKQVLAKMLPDFISLYPTDNKLHWEVYNMEGNDLGRLVQDTELLHLCCLVEETLTDNQTDMYGLYINGIMFESETIKFHSVCDWHATWQQRTIALAKVKGLDIQTQTYTSAL